MTQSKHFSNLPIDKFKTEKLHLRKEYFFEIMKKFIFLLTFLIIQFGFSVNSYAGLNDLIIRNVLLGVDYIPESNTVIAHYLEVVDRPGHDPQVNVGTQKTINFNGDKLIDEKNFEKQIEIDTDLYYEIFVNDLIFGKEAHIYDDARGRELTEDEINQYKEAILESNKKYIQNPPSEEELYSEIDKIMEEKGITSYYRKMNIFDYLTLPSTIILMIIALLIIINIKPILDRIKHRNVG